MTVLMHEKPIKDCVNNNPKSPNRLSPLWAYVSSVLKPNLGDGYTISFMEGINTNKFTSTKFNIVIKKGNEIAGVIETSFPSSSIEKNLRNFVQCRDGKFLDVKELSQDTVTGSITLLPLYDESGSKRTPIQNKWIDPQRKSSNTSVPWKQDFVLTYVVDQENSRLATLSGISSTSSISKANLDYLKTCNIIQSLNTFAQTIKDRYE